MEGGRTVPLLASSVAPSHSPTRIRAHLLAAALQAADILILGGSALLASHLCVALQVRGAADGEVLAAIVAVFAASFVLRQRGTYTPAALADRRGRLRAIPRAMAAGGVAGTVCLAAMPSATLRTGLWPLFWMFASGGLTAAAGLPASWLARRVTVAARFARRVAVVGATGYGGRVIARLLDDAAGEASVVGLYDDRPEGDRPKDERAADERAADECAADERAVGEAAGGLAVAGRLADLVARSRWEPVDAVVLALPLADVARIADARHALRSLTADIYLAGEILDLACRKGRLDRLGSCPVIKLGSRPMNEWQSLQKSAFDWIVAALLLVFLLPLLALTALAVRLDSPGPVLFRQKRRGLRDRPFQVFKFRTMYDHLADPHVERQTVPGDPRITRIGRFLRRTSIDELPQLLNVLRGEMSLVGPRPHAPNTRAGDELFADAVADYTLRYRVKPGITGWAQINGWRGETRTREQIVQRVAHDLHYIDNWSLLLDVKILVLTPWRELNSKVAF